MSMIRCLACNHENPNGETSCAACGSSLTLKLCAACEAVNHEAAGACHQCGAPLDGEAASVQAPPATRKPARRAAWLVALFALAAAAGVGYYGYEEPLRAFSALFQTAPDGAATQDSASPSALSLSKDSSDSGVAQTAVPATETPVPVRAAQEASGRVSPRVEAKPAQPAKASVPTIKPTAPDAAYARVTHTRAGPPSDPAEARSTQQRAKPALSEPGPANRSASAGPTVQREGDCSEQIAALNLCSRNTTGGRK